MSAEKAKETAALAANQGLYNGFLAAGLVLGLFADHGFVLKIFFLSCVVVAGTSCYCFARACRSTGNCS